MEYTLNPDFGVGSHRAVKSIRSKLDWVHYHGHPAWLLPEIRLKSFGNKGENQMRMNMEHGMESRAFRRHFTG